MRIVKGSLDNFNKEILLVSKFKGDPKLVLNGFLPYFCDSSPSKNDLFMSLISFDPCFIEDNGIGSTFYLRQKLSETIDSSDKILPVTTTKIYGKSYYEKYFNLASAVFYLGSFSTIKELNETHKEDIGNLLLFVGQNDLLQQKFSIYGKMLQDRVESDSRSLTLKRTQDYFIPYILNYKKFFLQPFVDGLCKTFLQSVENTPFFQTSKNLINYIMRSSDPLNDVVELYYAQMDAIEKEDYSLAKDLSYRLEPFTGHV